MQFDSGLGKFLTPKKKPKLVHISKGNPQNDRTTYSVNFKRDEMEFQILRKSVKHPAAGYLTELGVWKGKTSHVVSRLSCKMRRSDGSISDEICYIFTAYNW